MKLFTRLYDTSMRWARHRHATWYLGGLSFAESSFFPVPPDIMLAPMSMARPDRAMHYAALTTVASVLGGLLGYLIGYFAFEAITPWIKDAGYWEHYERAKDWFDRFGFWAMLIAGFSPIPYKVFTIAAGTLHMSLLPFIAASLVGRGARFFLVATILAWGGPKMEASIRPYVERTGWIVVIAGIIAYLIYR